MNEHMISEHLKKLEANAITMKLHSFLERKQDSQKVHNFFDMRDNNENLSEMLLDIIHIAFTSGYEAAIESIISSFTENTIE